jgi:hypothetical protein
VAQVDVRERQLIFKLVYYGPPLSGKTTNLQVLHERVHELNRGRLMTLDTRDDRTIFFDLLPIFFKDSKLSFRVKVYTVPGQPMHQATRRLVLRGADAVAFVADSRRAQQVANSDSFAEMLQNFEVVGLDASATPVVVQYNKRDLAEIVGDSELPAIAERLGRPLFPAAALHGGGVLETFFGLMHEAWRAVDARVGLERGFGIGGDEFMRALREHLRPGKLLTPD